LVNAGVQQRAPVFAEPAFRVALAAEGLLRHITGTCRGAVRLLEPPRPHHVRSTSTGEPSRAIRARPADPGGRPPGTPPLASGPAPPSPGGGPAGARPRGIVTRPECLTQRDSGPNAPRSVPTC